ncbi:AsnC family transcriptional regulator, partial [Candidatus Endoriftia persephone str. Guaymas]|nr:AsnC family transcriptional regulator [Candidatus Endoriftia persephone str. Guaymas]
MANPAPTYPQSQPRTLNPAPVELNDLEKRLLNEYQKGLPLTPTPYAD